MIRDFHKNGSETEITSAAVYNVFLTVGHFQVSEIKK